MIPALARRESVRVDLPWSTEERREGEEAEDQLAGRWWNDGGKQGRIWTNRER